MKLKEYFNSLVSRRKSTSSSSSKPTKPKAHHASISSTDGHYEICGYDDPNRITLNDHHSRTQTLLNRHAQLVNTIVGIRSQQINSSSQSRLPTLHQSHPQDNLVLNRNYSSTLATCSPRRECQLETLESTNKNSSGTTTRQRSKIRTNPWITTTRATQPEHSIYDSTVSTGLIHSESFPQTMSNGNIHSINPSKKNLHQSDSGQGVSLSSSRVIESSSTDNTSNDGILLDEKPLYHHEQYYPVKVNSSESKRRAKQNRYHQSSSNTRISSPKKTSYPSSHFYNDQYSIEFEDKVENKHRHKQRSSPSTRKSPFILPLDTENVQTSSTSPSNTNTNTILKHIEEIENEIRIIKNLNLHPDEQILSSHQNPRQSIHEQVDQWVDQCLTNQYDHLPNRKKNYILFDYSNNNENSQTASLPKPQKNPELMTAFYLSSIPSTKQTYSVLNQKTISKDFKSIHECPF